MSLKDVRLKNKLSQSQLSKLSEVNLRTIQSYEQGGKNIDHANLEILLKLSITLNCSIAELVTDNKLKQLIMRYEFINVF